MKDHIVRYATMQDLPSILPLMIQLGYLMSEVELIVRFEKFVKMEGYGIAVVCIKSDVAGLIAWSQTQCFLFDRKRFRIEGLVVDEKYRKRGVGKQLICFLEDIAKKYSPCVVDLTSGRWRGTSYEFYQKLGYRNEGTTEKIYLRKDL